MWILRFQIIILLTAACIPESNTCNCLCKTSGNVLHKVCDVISFLEGKLKESEKIKNHNDAIDKFSKGLRHDNGYPVINITEMVIERIKGYNGNGNNAGKWTETEKEIQAHFSSLAKILTEKINESLVKVKENFTSDMKNSYDGLKEFHDLQQKLKNHISTSSVEFELLPHLTSLEGNCSICEKFADMNNALDNFLSQISKETSTTNNATGNECVDSLGIEYCKQLVDANFCVHEAHAKACCASCKEAEQLP